MEPRDEQQADRRLEAFLDGQLDPATAEAFAQELQADPALRRSVELQGRIDAALKQRFAVTSADPAALAALLAQHAAVEDGADTREVPAVVHSSAGWRRNWLWIGVAIAACVAWCAVIWQLGYFRQHQPFFEARPLVQLYAEARQAGFKPYYECRDEVRFAETFLKRQGKPLRLLPMPAGTRMLGLSYAGGLSRQTTAMLCQVGETPVMVFVDRVNHDTATASENQNADLQVFRAEKDGLVFYEVSPLLQPQVTDFLVVAD